MAILSCSEATFQYDQDMNHTASNNEAVNTVQITSVTKDKHPLYYGSESLQPPVYLYLLKIHTSDGGLVIWRYNNVLVRDSDYAIILAL